ncbi:sensor histidine kinase [Sphingobacterium sp. LRF_L2]|uniref:sensor histidine kinase n=1 Tax=Sphingobacterium sp. LRF_L2 TaxID=3369421 RepID=UPI003F601F9C
MSNISSQQIIVALIVAIVVSKILIGILIYHLVKRKKQLKKERAILSKRNLLMEKHLLVIRSQQDELKSTENLKMKVLSIASHDLRSPFNDLNALFEHFDLLEMNPEGIKRSLSTVRDQMRASQMLLDNVLMWTVNHIRNDQEALKVRFSISEQIENTLAIFQVQIQEKQLQITCDLSEDDSVLGSVEVFNLVTRNIISNAIKYSNTLSVIKIGTNKENQSVTPSIYIRDHGIGMDQNTLEKIQQGDYQTSKKGTENEKGSGVGLSLCHELIGMQGWHMNVISQIGRGTTFEVFLPIEKTNLSQNPT